MCECRTAHIENARNVMVPTQEVNQTCSNWHDYAASKRDALYNALVGTLILCRYTFAAAMNVKSK